MLHYITIFTINYYCHHSDGIVTLPPGPNAHIPFMPLTDSFIGVWGEAAVLLVNAVVGEVNETV